MLYHWATAEPYRSKFNHKTEFMLDKFYDYGVKTYEVSCDFHEDI